jgi:phospholipid/cholesterol/gamma-HCH transport system ATP-binding protein
MARTADTAVTAVRPAEGDVSGRSERFQLRVRGLYKRFADFEVLRGVDLDIERGKINVVIGGSGAGKSVILKHLMGLLKPDEGQIWVDGEDIVPLSDYQLNRVRMKFGMLFQYAALFDSLTVEENVMFPLLEHRRGKLTRARMREIVRDKLQALGLFNVEKKYPAELSGGMRKRVGLARAIVLEPEVLYYDEPTTGLDPIATKNVDEMISDISEKLGVTSLVISHDMASTFRIGHRVSMLYKGRIIASGTPEELLHHGDPNLREFIATSGAVRLPPLAGEEGRAER